MAERTSSGASEADRELAKKSEDDIRAEVSFYSFDIATLKKRVGDDDHAQAFLQAHLYLDHVVTRLLTEEVRFPDFYNLTVQVSPKSSS